ncbi:phasin family protein [Micromonospora cathayae]|uniref:Polyhydroxyalkanoate synthesis regulator phasin n=1 Tax=Micromonospora cathayae TaxID=3028804 RepID=A0ABY7ZIY1_9ACTN|nr:hypothetical protein [Micromonospora sp. HUAS 3]WDZ82391.1 hypothetical protein PVK37_18060 [Micromonospora sp. HUAS 3]
MQDAWRAYLELALGLTEAPRKRAQDAVRRLVGSGGATAAQLQALAEELVATSTANREALTKLVRFEVDRALGAVGLATADEVAELTRRVHELERQLREARAATPTPSAEPVATPAVPTPAVVAERTVAKKTVAKKAVAKKAVAKRTPATETPTAAQGPESSPPRKAPGKRPPAKKATPGAGAAQGRAQAASGGAGTPTPDGAA